MGFPRSSSHVLPGWKVSGFRVPESMAEEASGARLGFMVSWVLGIVIRVSIGREEEGLRD